MIAKNVGEIAAPAMTAIVGVQAVAKSLVSGFLHGYVESGVDAQALLVNGIGSVSLLEILANILDEVGRKIISLRLDVESQGRAACGIGLLRGDFAVVSHEREDQIPPRQSALRVD